MISILAEQGTETVAQTLAGALSQEYKLPCAPEVVTADAVWGRSVEWDDLLLVVYKSRELPASAVQYIQAYRNLHRSGGPIIPVGTSADFPVPPEPISEIKAARYDGSPEMTRRLVKSVGTFLGLALRPGSFRIFVSYRARDGKELAAELYSRLRSEGFEPWLDEAEENIAIGDEVQDRIRKSVRSAAMILLVDTPESPDSKWVKVEVDLANGQLIPVLPVVAGGERISRFIQLQGLRRQVVVSWSGPGALLSDADWDSVRSEVNELLLSSFRRRSKILSRAQAAFEANGYNWEAIDDRLRMYRADKKTAPLAKVIILSHCLVHDITYVPALKAYWDYLKAYSDLATVNQKLCIYDRDRVLSESEMQTLADNLPEMNAILAHYNELELLVASNFTALRK